jgi:hypothetical protein
VKAKAKGRSKSCQIDQSFVACVMGHLLLRYQMGW